MNLLSKKCTVPSKGWKKALKKQKTAKRGTEKGICVPAG